MLTVLDALLELWRLITYRTTEPYPPAVAIGRHALYAEPVSQRWQVTVCAVSPDGQLRLLAQHAGTVDDPWASEQQIRDAVTRRWVAQYGWPEPERRLAVLVNR